jgi:hypothetical protein
MGYQPNNNNGYSGNHHPMISDLFDPLLIETAFFIGESSSQRFFQLSRVGFSGVITTNPY